MNRIAVTGANGFVGAAAVNELVSRGLEVRRIVRQQSGDEPLDNTVVVGDVHGMTDWCKALVGIEAVVHTVARTHITRDQHSLDQYRVVNVDGTRRLAQQAVAAGVKRFLFISSIKVNGERTFGRPFRPDDVPAPEDAYGISKCEAEEGLADVASGSGMESVIIRPPLIYGPGVKGNFARLMALIANRFPLPLARVNNRRSIVALCNLIDLLVRCINTPHARNRMFLVSDDRPLSTPDLACSIAAAMGRRAWLFPVPVQTLRLLGRLSGRGAEVDRLCSSLEVDDSETRNLLNWRPPISPHDAIRATVDHFMKSRYRRLSPKRS